MKIATYRVENYIGRKKTSKPIDPNVDRRNGILH